MKKSTTATAFLLFTTLLWGMTFAFIKDAMSSLSAFDFLFWRFGIATLFLGVLFFKKIQLGSGKLILQGVLLGVFLGGTVIFQTIGLRYTTASTASFITGLSVILVPLYCCLRVRQLPSFNVTVAVMMTVMGISLISLTEFSVNVGDLWVIWSAICFAVYIILTGRFSQSGQAMTLTFCQSLTITVLVGLLNLFHSNGFIIPTQGNVWLDILFCAIFASVLAFYLQIHFQRHVTATKTALIFALEPVFATLMAIVYLGEELTLRFMMGALCIFIGMLLAEVRRKKSAQSSESVA